jgi:hypothetical protein
MSVMGPTTVLTAPTSDFQSSPNNGHYQTRTGRFVPAVGKRMFDCLSTLMYDARSFIKPLHSFGVRRCNRY